MQAIKNNSLNVGGKAIYMEGCAYNMSEQQKALARKKKGYDLIALIAIRILEQKNALLLVNDKV